MGIIVSGVFWTGVVSIAMIILAQLAKIGDPDGGNVDSEGNPRLTSGRRSSDFDTQWDERVENKFSRDKRD